MSGEIPEIRVGVFPRSRRPAFSRGPGRRKFAPNPTLESVRMASVIVLGAGRVGAAMARDLAADGLDVAAADADPAALARLEMGPRPVRGVHVDLSDPEQLGRRVQGHDLVIGAVPGPMGYRTVRGVLAAGVDIVDISFFEEDAFTLDAEARRRGVVAVVDAGVAPGLSNLILGHWEHRLRAVHRFECLVGGIPADPEPPWRYRAPFSPIDVIAEYTRPARLRRDGETVTLPALSELERVEVEGVGEMEAFNTDGLRTLLRTSVTPELVEKTLRWPGHADRVRLLRDSGFLSSDPVDVDGRPIAPLSVSARLLSDAWAYGPDEADLTVMRVVVEGADAEGPVRHVYRLLDRYDPETGVSSMARTTGYTATAIARLVLDGGYREPGVSPPERVAAADGALDRVVAALRDRGVGLEHEVVRS
ncbi:MAG: saccharopine dehydrogenase C-terminal domain-containing protein [Longimicrobiales bacterium]|nr:saccharopine dehydrogenase C-terminal domain-containing protein [Longimicrobiales bacterium]